MNYKTSLRHLKFLEKQSEIMPLAAENWKSPWQTLIAIILSARTRDETTIRVCKILFARYPHAKNLANAKLEDVRKILHPVNYFNNKSKNIINCSKVLVEEYNSEIPGTIDELIKLPGVGRKTANVFLSEMGKDALGVDTHVAYISRKLGWTKNSNPHKIEKDLKSLFPKRYWKEVNPIVVRFGKSHMSRKKKDEILNKIKKMK
ncbi:MAG TPA: endonuclease III [Patescibacteria group bacterium]|nr:endonuclease III [Patescibacteria group bacterium]